MTPAAHPGVDESRGRLTRAGWSVGEVACDPLWHVTGRNGENLLGASATTQVGAWWRACVQAREVGMLAPTGEAGCGRVP